jgi:APA family basic amino acid/polyamine antiporter
MILLATLTTLIPYLLVSAAYVVMAIESQEPLTKKEWPRVIVPASLAFVFSLLAIIGAGQETVYWGLVLLLAGIPFYVWDVWKRRPRRPV